MVVLRWRGKWQIFVQCKGFIFWGLGILRFFSATRVLQKLFIFCSVISLCSYFFVHTIQTVFKFSLARIGFGQFLIYTDGRVRQRKTERKESHTRDNNLNEQMEEKKIRSFCFSRQCNKNKVNHNTQIKYQKI